MVDDERRRPAGDGNRLGNNPENNEASPLNPDPNSPPSYNAPSPDAFVVTSTTPTEEQQRNPMLPGRRRENSEATPPSSVEPQPDEDEHPPADSPPDARIVTSTTGTGAVTTNTVSSTRNPPVDQLAGMSLDESGNINPAGGAVNPPAASGHIGNVEPTPTNLPCVGSGTAGQASTSRQNPATSTSGQPPRLNPATSTSGQPPRLNPASTSQQPPHLNPVGPSPGVSHGKNPVAPTFGVPPHINPVASTSTHSSHNTVPVQPGMASGASMGKNLKRHSDPILGQDRPSTSDISRTRPTSLNLSKSKDQKVDITSPIKPPTKNVSPNTKRPAKPCSEEGGNGSYPGGVLSPLKKPRITPASMETEPLQMSENENESEDDMDVDSKNLPSDKKPNSSEDGK